MKTSPAGNLPDVELTTPGSAVLERCPDLFSAFASRAELSCWGDEQSIVRKVGDRALETVLVAPSGAHFIRVATSPQGSRVAALRTTGASRSVLTLVEGDGTKRELDNVAAFALCDDGRTFIADNTAIRCVDRNGAAVGPARDTGGYVPADLREDGHAAIPMWGGVKLLTPSGEEITIEAGKGPTKTITLHPSLPLVAAQFDDEGMLRVIDWQKREVLFAHSAPWCRGVMTLSFSPDGSRIVAVGPGVTAFDVASGAQLFQLPGGFQVTGGFAQDGNLILASSRTLAKLDINAAGAAQELMPSPMFSLGFSRDGSKLAFVRAQRAFMADLRTGEERPGVLSDDDACARVNAVTILGSDTLVVHATREDGSCPLLFIDVSTQSVRKRIEAPDVARMSVSPDATRLALAGNTLSLYDPATDERVVLATDEHGFGALGWTPAGVSVQRRGPNSMGPIEVYSLVSGAKPAVCAIAKASAGLADRAFAHGNTVVIVASSALLIGTLDTRKTTSKVFMKNLVAAAHSGDGRRFAVVDYTSEEGRVYELDDSGAPSAIARFAAKGVHAIELSHDGGLLAVAADTSYAIGPIPFGR